MQQRLSHAYALNKFSTIFCLFILHVKFGEANLLPEAAKKDQEKEMKKKARKDWSKEKNKESMKRLKN